MIAAVKPAPVQQFVTSMTRAGELAVSAAVASHVLEDYVGPQAHQAGNAVADATKAVALVEDALDLGYLDSDDALSFGDYAVEQLNAGIAALAPVVGVKPDFGQARKQVETALSTSKDHFLNANGWISESIGSMP